MINHYLPTSNIKVQPTNFLFIFDDKSDECSISFSLKRYLSDVKNQIEQNIKLWDSKKKLTNPVEYIHTLAKPHNKSVSKLKPLSRAFYKLVEILNTYNILNRYKLQPLRSFHLAEGPGGFIEALSYLRRNERDQYIGMTLVNSNENTPGWKKAKDFLARQNNVRIEKGIDNTGNLFNPKNLIRTVSINIVVRWI